MVKWMVKWMDGWMGASPLTRKLSISYIQPTVHPSIYIHRMNYLLKSRISLLRLGVLMMNDFEFFFVCFECGSGSSCVWVREESKWVMN
jgi:hypothetical protein